MLCKVNDDGHIRCDVGAQPFGSERAGNKHNGTYTKRKEWVPAWMVRWQNYTNEKIYDSMLKPDQDHESIRKHEGSLFEAHTNNYLVGASLVGGVENKYYIKCPDGNFWKKTGDGKVKCEPFDKYIACMDNVGDDSCGDFQFKVSDWNSDGTTGKSNAAVEFSSGGLACGHKGHSEDPSAVLNCLTERKSGEEEEAFFVHTEDGGCFPKCNSYQMRVCEEERTTT